MVAGTAIATVVLSSVGIAAVSPARAAALHQGRAPQVHAPAGNDQVTQDASLISAEDTPSLAQDPVHPAERVVSKPKRRRAG